MTLAKVENGSVTQVGLPASLHGTPLRDLKAQGWHQVVDNGAGKPSTATDPGYHWVYGASWSIEEGKVVGTWQQAQRPQPYPSWSWVAGEGWVPPVAKPTDGKDYTWDEDAQQWVEETFA